LGRARSPDIREQANKQVWILPATCLDTFRRSA
jgi:hypothetical protein